jgi:sarcosine oxidase subunit delta
MIVLRCPYCHEEKTEEELIYGGEAGAERPSPDQASDVQWTDYLFMRLNRKGLYREQWCCSAGCGQWFKVARDTVTHEVREVLRIDESFTLDTLTGRSLTDKPCARKAALNERAAEARPAPRSTGARSSGPDVHITPTTGGSEPTACVTDPLPPVRR